MVTWSTIPVTGWTTTSNSAYRSGGIDEWGQYAISTEAGTSGTVSMSFVFNSNTPSDPELAGLHQGAPVPGYTITGAFSLVSGGTCSVSYDDTGFTNAFTYAGETLKVVYDFDAGEIKWYKDTTLLRTQSHTFTSVNVAVSCFGVASTDGINTLVYPDDPTPSSSGTRLPPQPIILENF